MRIINARVHAFIDCLVVVFLLAAPSLFGLPETAALCTCLPGASTSA